MDIGSKLKEIRTLKGLTQEELAGPGRAFRDSYPTGTQPDLSLYRDAHRHPAVPRHHTRSF